MTLPALGETQPRWRRVRLVREAATPLWLLTHRDVVEGRRSAA